MGGILWLLVIAVLFYFMMRFGCGAHMVHGGHGSHGGWPGEKSHKDPLKDPVCGMQFPASTGHSRIYQDQEYRFCSRECLDKFEAEPARYGTSKGVGK